MREILRLLKEIVYIVCTIILIVAAWNLWCIYRSTKSTNELYNGLAERVHRVADETSDESEETIPEGSDTEEELLLKDDVQSPEERIRNPWILELQEDNSDLIAWIRIPETVIDYPVMWREVDDDYYLTHDFKGDSNSHGAPFLDTYCNIDTSDNLIIYGHHMRDGTMFQNLMLYREDEFCEENNKIYLDTYYSSRVYEVLLVVVISEEESQSFPYYRYVNLTKKSYKDFLNQCSKYAIWEAEEMPKYGTQLLTLSTCEYTKNNGRLVIVAGKI